MLINNNFKRYKESENDNKGRGKSSFFIKLNNFRLVVYNIFFYIIVLSLLYLVLSLFSNSITNLVKGLFLKAPSTLIVNFDGQIIEDYSGYEEREATSYFQICECLRLCASDKNIKQLLLNLDNLSYIDLVQVEELGSLINNLPSDIEVVAYSSSYGQLSYALASYADRVVMHKNGEVVFKGVSLYALFYKRLFDKIGVKFNVIATGDYKSAGEPYTREEFSKKAKENLEELTLSIYKSISSIIDENRSKISTSGSSLTAGKNLFQDYLTNLPLLITNYKNQTSDFSQYENIFSHIALDYGLVDQAISLPASYKTADLLKELNLNSSYVNGSDYILKRGSGFALNKIGVLTLEGSIVDESYSRSGVIVPNRVCKEASELFKDETVKAVVLRINSGGGSAVASEAIRAHIKNLSVTHNKPVVVSMGNTCASGGYWISTLAREIYTNKNSLTGSIGVVSLVPDFSVLAKERLSLTSDTITYGGVSPSTFLEPLNEKQKILSQAEVDLIYSKFINLVSDYSGKSDSEVLANAGGRVYMGTDFASLGYANAVGTFYEAVSAAARLASITSYKLYFKRQTTSFSQILASQIQKEFFNKASLNKAADNFEAYIDSVKQTSGVQLLAPLSIDAY